jgi:RNA ligase (TIGR02306 family)
MVEINRKLATIRKIAEIRPIEGADKIEAAKVDDWWIIIQKNKHNVGDLILFFEIDSFLPVEEKYEFLRKSSFKSTKNLGDGFRIKSMKMKGQISQGLIFPLEDFSPEIRKMGDLYEEGQDFTEILKIQKYENPISANLAGIARGNFPSFIPKTDQERYQNLRKRDLEKYLNMPFEVTLKMDGTSMTVYKNEDDFGICLINIILKKF